MWVVTTEYNDYNQHGEYFLAAFSKKPSFKQLKILIQENDVIVGKLTRGGGRHEVEFKWYNLIEVKDRSIIV